ncbi:hypothetical protein PAGU2595_029400 [Lysobacter xanthus]
MDRNPYEPPGSSLGGENVPRPIGFLTHGLGLPAFLFGMVGVVVNLASGDFIERASVEPARLVLGLSLAGASLIAGGALFQLHRLSLPAYGAAAMLTLLSAGWNRTSLGVGAGLFALFAAGFVYSMWLNRRGLLGKRPNNSSKPTPLRGAA